MGLWAARPPEEVEVGEALEQQRKLKYCARGLSRLPALQQVAVVLVLELEVAVQVQFSQQLVLWTSFDQATVVIAELVVELAVKAYHLRSS